MARFQTGMRNIGATLATLLVLGLPAFAGKLVDAPPPPPIPDYLPEEDAVPAEPASHENIVNETVGLGQLLYQTHCMNCHESVARIRNRQAVKSLPQLRAQVVHWAEDGRLQWSGEETEAVVRYLNDSFYRY